MDRIWRTTAPRVITLAVVRTIYKKNIFEDDYKVPDNKLVKNENTWPFIIDGIGENPR